jgi:hypothetical protein
MAVALVTSGHNNPPGPIEMAGETIKDISDWMKEHPVVETEEDARLAKPLIDRAKAALEELEIERDNKVRPLNTQVATINAQYKALHNTDPKKPALYDRVLNELKGRVAAFLIAEEQRRLAAAEEARKKAVEAGRVAREAEAAEAEALASASVGELDVDVAAVTADADSKFADFERESRFAARADRDTKVKIGGGFKNAASLRTVETLHLDSYNKALKAIGPHAKIEEAILMAAREFRKANGQLPDGVSATTERVL